MIFMGKEGAPQFTPAQKEHLRRFAYIQIMADALEKEVVNEMRVKHVIRSQSPDEAVIKPTRQAVEIFRRVARSVYQDEILTDDNPWVQKFADDVDRVREQRKDQKDD